MALPQGERNARWRRRLRKRLLLQLGGGRCVMGGERARLEFAHLKQTSVSGRGRGSHARLLDVRRHPGRYVVLCRRHHGALDGFLPPPPAA